MSYMKRVTEVNQIAKMLNVSSTDAFSLVQGTLGELSKLENPSQKDVLDSMIKYVEKFKNITKMIQKDPELMKLTQQNILNSFHSLESWEK